VYCSARLARHNERVALCSLFQSLRSAGRRFTDDCNCFRWQSDFTGIHLKSDDNQVVDTKVGKAPLTYTHGANQIIRGVETAVEGMTVGEAKHVTVIRPIVKEIKDNTVLLDFNHPLAGKTLFFDVKVLDVH